MPIGQIGASFGNNKDLGNVTGEQNSSQQQTRGKGTFHRLIGGANLNNASNYLGTNLLTASLDDGTLPMYNQLLLPS